MRTPKTTKSESFCRFFASEGLTLGARATDLPLVLIWRASIVQFLSCDQDAQPAGSEGLNPSSVRRRECADLEALASVATPRHPRRRNHQRITVLRVTSERLKVARPENDKKSVFLSFRCLRRSNGRCASPRSACGSDPGRASSSGVSCQATVIHLGDEASIPHAFADVYEWI